MNDRPQLLTRQIQTTKSPGALAAILREAILDGGFRLGERLPSERDLVDQTGLSRGSVREALRLLEAEGLLSVTAGRNGGSIVSRPDLDSVAGFLDIYVRSNAISAQVVHQTRQIIEPALAALAAENHKPGDIPPLRSLNARLLAAGSNRRFFAQINFEWHQRIAALSGNELMATMLYAISRNVVQLTASRGFERQEIPVTVHRIHERVIDAIEARDAAAAMRRMQRHLRATAECAAEWNVNFDG